MVRCVVYDVWFNEAWWCGVWWCSGAVVYGGVMWCLVCGQLRCMANCVWCEVRGGVWCEKLGVNTRWCTVAWWAVAGQRSVHLLLMRREDHLCPERRAILHRRCRREPARLADLPVPAAVELPQRERLQPRPVPHLVRHQKLRVEPLDREVLAPLRLDRLRVLLMHSDADEVAVGEQPPRDDDERLGVASSADCEQQEVAARSELRGHEVREGVRRNVCNVCNVLGGKRNG